MHRGGIIRTENASGRTHLNVPYLLYGGSKLPEAFLEGLFESDGVGNVPIPINFHGVEIGATLITRYFF